MDGEKIWIALYSTFRSSFQMLSRSVGPLASNHFLGSAFLETCWPILLGSNVVVLYLRLLLFTPTNFLQFRSFKKIACLMLKLHFRTFPFCLFKLLKMHWMSCKKTKSLKSVCQNEFSHFCVPFSVLVRFHLWNIMFFSQDSLLRKHSLPLKKTALLQNVIQEVLFLAFRRL